MSTPRQITDLEIVGYATVLKDTMVPSIVPPVFRLKADASRILFPPYTFAAGSVWNATEASTHDLERLAENREITRFEKPFPAQRDFELWVDQKMEPHYRPHAKAHETLRSIANDSIQHARGAFAKGDQAGADRLCGIALSADDRLIEALAIKAAIRRQKQDAAGERVMAKLASRTLGPEAFERLVSDCVQSAPSKSDSPDFFGLRPMFGMAAVRPEPVPA